MKLVVFSALVLSLVSGYAYAGGGQTPEAESPSDRPAAARLDEANCQAVWKLTERDGDVLTADKATPYIVNFQMVDTNKDGRISEAEFAEGCNGGWVLQAEKSDKMQPSAPNP
jgi:EF hand